MPINGKLAAELIQDSNLSEEDILQAWTQFNLQIEDLEVVDEHGASLLHHAAKAGKSELCRWLLLHYNNLINCKSIAGTNPLFYAAQSNNLLTFQLIYNTKPSLLMETNNFGFNIFHHHAIGGDLSLFETINGLVSTERSQEWLLARGTEDTSPLDMLIDNNHKNCILFMIELLKSHPHIDAIIYPALSKIVKEGKLDYLQHITQQTDTNWLNFPIPNIILCKDPETSTSTTYLLDIATDANQLAIVEWILTQNLEIIFDKARCEYHVWLLVDCLFRLNYNDLVDELLNQNIIRFNTDESTSGLKSIHYAYSLNNPILLEWLQSHNLNTLPLTQGLLKTQLHPLHLAAMNDAVDIFQYYQDHHLKYDELDSHGNLPIHYAIIFRANKVLNWLAQHAPHTLNIKSDLKLSPLHLAVCLGNTYALKCLISHLLPTRDDFMIDHQYSALNFLTGMGITTSLRIIFNIVTKELGKEDLFDSKLHNPKILDVPEALWSITGDLTYTVLEKVLAEQFIKPGRMLRTSHLNPCKPETTATLTQTLDYLDQKYSLKVLFKKGDAIVAYLPHHAAAYNRIELLQLMTNYLDDFSAFHRLDQLKRLPIHYAFEQNAEESLRFLIAQGALIDKTITDNDFEKITGLIGNKNPSLYLTLGLKIQSDENSNHSHPNFIFSSKQIKNNPALFDLLSENEKNQLIKTLIFHLNYREEKLQPHLQIQLFEILTIINPTNMNDNLSLIEYKK